MVRTLQFRIQTHIVYMYLVRAAAFVHLSNTFSFFSILDLFSFHTRYTSRNKGFFCNCFCFLQWLLKLFMNNFLVWLFLFFRTLLPILLKAEQMTQGDGALPVLIQLQRTGSRLKSYIKVK